MKVANLAMIQSMEENFPLIHDLYKSVRNVKKQKNVLKTFKMDKATKPNLPRPEDLFFFFF